MSATTSVEEQDRAAVTHLLVSSFHLALGGALMLLTLASRTFPEILIGPLSYGRIKPMALTVLIVGWLAPALAGAAYHVLPRLTGTLLRNERLATLGGWALGALSLLGAFVHGLGSGDGRGLLGLPWWLDLAVVGALVVPLAVTIQTTRHRTEEGVFPTLWFVAGGVVSLPVLALVAALPADSGLPAALQGVTFDAGFQTLWVTTMGAGAGYYVAVRATGNPLANRNLARAGMVSLLFAGIWAGPAQIAFAPYPEWLGPVTAAFTLALPVAALAYGYGIAQTVGHGWWETDSKPALAALGSALIFALAAAITTSVATFGSASAMVGFTEFWDGIRYLVLFGVGGMFVAAWAYQTLPAMTGRMLADVGAANRHVRWTLWFVGGTALLLMLSGIAAGMGMTGGSYAALGPEGWSELMGPADALAGLAVITGAGAFAAQGLFVLNVYRTLTSGHITEREVLVAETRA